MRPAHARRWWIEVARQCGQETRTEKTVENHVRNIPGKLHLNRRQELIRYALDHGIE